MAICSLLGTLIRFHGKPHLPHTTVERTMWEYLQYMHLVTLPQFIMKDQNVKLIFLARIKGMFLPSALLLQQFLYRLGTLHKSHTSKIKLLTSKWNKKRSQRNRQPTSRSTAERPWQAEASRVLQHNSVPCAVLRMSNWVCINVEDRAVSGTDAMTKDTMKT